MAGQGNVALSTSLLLATGYLLGYRGTSRMAGGASTRPCQCRLTFAQGQAGEHRADAWVSIADRALLLVGSRCFLRVMRFKWLLGDNWP